MSVARRVDYEIDIAIKFDWLVDVEFDELEIFIVEVIGEAFPSDFFIATRREDFHADIFLHEHIDKHSADKTARASQEQTFPREFFPRQIFSDDGFYVFGVNFVIDIHFSTSLEPGSFFSGNQRLEHLDIVNGRDFDIFIGAACKVQRLAQINHHRIDVGRTVNANFLLERFLVSPVEFAELVSLRSLDAAQSFAHDIFLGAGVVELPKNLLVVGQARNAVAVFPASRDNVGQNFFVDHWANPVVNDNNIIVGILLLYGENAVARRLLNSRAALDDSFQLRDIVLTGIGAQNVMPAV